MIYKRGKTGIYWYRFQWKNQTVRKSTKQCNGNKARQMEAAHRTRLEHRDGPVREGTQGVEPEDGESRTESVHQVGDQAERGR